jgi:hypothetical protein
MNLPKNHAAQIARYVERRLSNGKQATVTRRAPGPHREAIGLARRRRRDCGQLRQVAQRILGRRSRRISKWRCGPLALPVAPTSAITSPFSTNAPFFTRTARLWA